MSPFYFGIPIYAVSHIETSSFAMKAACTFQFGNNVSGIRLTKPLLGSNIFSVAFTGYRIQDTWILHIKNILLRNFKYYALQKQ